MFHNNEDPGWGGPTGFYRTDYHALLDPETSATWAPIYLWADPDTYDQPLMSMTFLADPSQPPPADRAFWIELEAVPKDVEGAPPEGMIWPVPLNRALTIAVPTYETYTGVDGYRFALHAGAAPEPGVAAALLAVLVVFRGRRGSAARCAR